MGDPLRQLRPVNLHLGVGRLQRPPRRAAKAAYDTIRDGLAARKTAVKA